MNLIDIDRLRKELMAKGDIPIHEVFNTIWDQPIVNICEVKEQQPCEDCISREAVINELKLGYFYMDLQEGKNDPCVIDAMIDWAIRAVKRQPSVTPQPTGWIPVSERLPEEDGTLRGYLVNVGYWVGIACFVNGEFWRSYAPEKIGFDYPVKAWMPLPTPYAESDKEEEE